MSERVYIVEPRDPLIARDGRPFQNSPGARARTLPFPLPPTLIGALRTQAGTRNGRFDPTTIGTVLNYSLRGPLLVGLNPDASVAEWFAPAPLDSLMLDSKKLYALKPFQMESNALSDLEGMLLVGRDDLPKDKPKGMPRYWKWSRFAEWLKEAKDELKTTPEALGIAGPTLEFRTHVRIDPNTQMAKEGELFQTSGLEFSYLPKDAGLNTAQRLALLYATDATQQNPRLGSLGGERRLMFWRDTPDTFDQTTLCTEISNLITDSRTGKFYCRVILLTPAYFEKGHLPTWLLSNQHGVQPTLKAVASDRPVVISGWDYAANNGRGHPKPTRRLAPAGSVYFLELAGEKADVETWIKGLWLQNISDDPQSRLDGLGLAVIGTWSGLEDSHA